MKKILGFLFLSYSVLCANSLSLEIKCNQENNYEACVDLGYDYLSEMDRSGGYELFEKACKNKYAKGCYSMGSMWENDWYGNENNVTNAIKYYTLAGDIGYCLGYIRAGDIYNENSELSAYVNPDSKKS